MVKLLIDGDMLVYTLGYASEKKGHFVDGTPYHESDLSLCKRLIRRAIQRYCRLFNTKEFELVLSGSGNYRNDFFPAYKANRKTLVKPLVYESIRKWMMSLPECVVINGEEADDYLASSVTTSEGEGNIIITADKDFFTVPGKIYSLSTKRLFTPRLEQCFSFLFFQALCGDRVDGYFGVSWVGMRKARKLLEHCHIKKMTIRQTYLYLKERVLARTKVKGERNWKGWKEFRLCLSLAALRWADEEGSIWIGIQRVFKYRKVGFQFFLPYYDPIENIKHGEVVEMNY